MCCGGICVQITIHLILICLLIYAYLHFWHGLTVSFVYRSDAIDTFFGEARNVWHMVPTMIESFAKFCYYIAANMFCDFMHLPCKEYGVPLNPR